MQEHGSGEDGTPGAGSRCPSISQALRIGTLFQLLGDEAGVHANPHRFRHTFATWAIEAEAREIDVQCLLGHSTAVMTRRYAATYDASKAAARHNDFSPVKLGIVAPS